ncbi:MAG: HAD family hydrolase [Gemmatimonadaceae bacterium]
MTQPLKVGLVYDFDGTLAPGNMQEHSFLPTLGINAADFWADVKERTRSHNADEILVYMWRMLEIARRNNVQVSKDDLKRHGSTLNYVPGVDTWFDRINLYGTERGLHIEHYIISSGIYEIIRGCSIFPKFTYVFASKFIFENNVAVWPATGINYTSKTQHLFRINKGIKTIWDNSNINKWIPEEERPIPFSRMIFIGDGETDVPAMRTVRMQGGCSIAVYDPQKIGSDSAQRVLHGLIAEKRVNFVAPADYGDGSQLDLTVKGVLGGIARR